MSWFWNKEKAKQEDGSPSECPVDHKTREAWLAEAAKSKTPAQSCDSSQMDQSMLTPHPFTISKLGTQREVSTIPRGSLNDTSTSPTKPAKPANNEQETGSDKVSGNWIYPSEQMFFNAMRRKGFEGREDDMRTIVPIHNAVNERAWYEIKQWEKGRGADA
jgi:cytochrome c heme-lyase